jgi:peptide-methionine (S)-S-oxide reductase
MQIHSTMPIEEIYFAGGCLWGVQEFLRHLPGVVHTEAGRANGHSQTTQGGYDGYAECVRVRFEPAKVSTSRLMDYFFEIIDPHSLNRQGPDVGPKYRTGVYSREPAHLQQARAYIANRPDHQRIVVEVKPLSNYVKSDATHQDRLTRKPDDPCHIPRALLYKYRDSKSDTAERGS